MKKCLFLFSISYVALFKVHAQDTLVVENNNKIEEWIVKIIKVSNEEVEYKDWSNLDGMEETINSRYIYRIKYRSGDIKIFNTTSLKGKRKQNAIYVGLAGLNYFVSANYERKLFYTKKLNFIAVNAGISGVPSFNSKKIENIYIMSTTLSYNINLLGYRKSIEFGMGGGYYITGSSVHSNYEYFSPIIGYRNETNEGFFFKFYFSMLTVKDLDYSNTFDRFYYYPFVGIDLGAAF